MSEDQCSPLPSNHRDRSLPPSCAPIFLSTIFLSTKPIPDAAGSMQRGERHSEHLSPLIATNSLAIMSEDQCSPLPSNHRDRSLPPSCAPIFLSTIFLSTKPFPDADLRTSSETG
nr:hypothetical protein [uncultured bacterium]